MVGVAERSKPFTEKNAQIKFHTKLPIDIMGQLTQKSTSTVKLKALTGSFMKQGE